MSWELGVVAIGFAVLVWSMVQFVGMIMNFVNYRQERARTWAKEDEESELQGPKGFQND